jgi:DNA polymerase-3 subunit delta
MATSASPILTDATVSLFYGDSELLTARAVEQVLAVRVAPADRDYALVRLRGAEATGARLRAEAASVSLLSPQRVIVVEEADSLPAKVQDEMASVVSALPEGVAIIFRAGPGRGGRSPLGAALTKAIAKAGQAVDLSPGPAQRVAATLAAEAARQGKRLPPAVAMRLLEMVGGDFDGACRELDKLVLYVGERPEIAAADVDLVASASVEGNTFRFCDAVGLRDARQALRLLDDLLPVGSRRGSALGIMGMLARQLRLLWQAQAVRGVQDAKGRLAERLPEEHNYFAATAGKSWLVRNLSNQAGKWKPEELGRALLLVYETDRRLKGLSDGQIDERRAMELLLAELGR